MTQKQMKAQINALGLTVREKDGEIRVNYRDGKEETAYYTNDRKDAVDTATAMDKSLTGLQNQLCSQIVEN